MEQSESTGTGGFYVSPFDTHDEAKARVDDVRRHCNAANPRAAFWAFGMCRLKDDADRMLGKLNAALMKEAA